MDPLELLERLVIVLERMKVPYLTVGSMATISFGEPRLTNDIDVVIDLYQPQIAEFCAAFPDPEYYLSRRAVESAVSRRHQFNIIHPSSGLKIDCILPGRSEFDVSQMMRGVRQPILDNRTAVFSSPEDVIIKKLEYYREGGSDKHLRDIRGVLKMQGDKIDRAYLMAWIDKLELRKEWEEVEYPEEPDRS
jgi:hypothetical protein